VKTTRYIMSEVRGNFQRSQHSRIYRRSYRCLQQHVRQLTVMAQAGAVHSPRSYYLWRSWRENLVPRFSTRRSSTLPPPWT